MATKESGKTGPTYSGKREIVFRLNGSLVKVRRRDGIMSAKVLADRATRVTLLAVDGKPARSKRGN